MGIISSGNYYVPIDKRLPKKRISTMLETVNSKVLICSKRYESDLEGINFEGASFFLEELINAKSDLDTLSEIRKTHINTDPLYAIFTSGSTGIPKGVLICHRSVINLIENFAQIFKFNHASIFGNQAPFDFDVSVKDIFSTLKNCATMFVIPKVLFSFPGNLIKFLNQKKINTVIWATSALRIVANLKALENEKPKYLKKIMFSGEVMPNKVLNYWRGHVADAEYVNLYGPTEITCNCTYYIVNRKFLDTELLPIGIQFPNSDVFFIK